MTCLMNVAPFGLPKPVTLSQPGPVDREESVPKVMTYQLVEEGLWYSALTNRVVGGCGAARNNALRFWFGFGGFLITPVTLFLVAAAVGLTSRKALLSIE